MEHLEGGEDPVPGVRVLPEDHVPGGLASELRTATLHLFPDITVADLRAHKGDAVLGEGRFEAPVGHDRAHDEHRVEAAVSREVPRRKRKDEIAVVRPPAFVDHDHAIAVAVEREPSVGLVLDDEALQCLRCGRPGAGVDVQTVGRVEEREHLRAGVSEHRRRDAIGRAIRTVESDAHALEARRHRDEEVLVVLDQPPRVADQADPALGRARERVFAGHERLDPVFGRVRQFLSTVVEELDPVVRRGVVRGADDRTGHEVVHLCDVANEADLHPDRAQPGGERALEHAAASTGVAAYHDRVAGTAEHVPGRAPEPERELRRQIEVGDTADPVGAKKPGQLLLVRMVSMTRVGCTLWAVTLAGTRTVTSTG